MQFPQAEQRPGAPAPGGGVPVAESPSERAARLHGEALTTNPERYGGRAQQDVDRVFGRQARHREGFFGLLDLPEYARTSASRHGESLAPGFDSQPVRLAILRGDVAAQDAAALASLAGRAQKTLADKEGAAAQAKAQVLGDINHAEASGWLSPDEAISRRAMVEHIFADELAAIQSILKDADQASEDLRGGVDQGRISLGEAGPVAFARTHVTDDLIREHFERALQPDLTAEQRVFQRESLEKDLRRVVAFDPAAYALPSAGAELASARQHAHEVAQSFLAKEGMFTEPSPQRWAVKYWNKKGETARDAYRSSLDQAAFIQGEVDRIRQEALSKGLAQVQPGGAILLSDPGEEARLQGMEDAIQHIEKGAFDLDDLGTALESFVQDRQAQLDKLNTPDVVDQKTVDMVSDAQLRGEASEVEIIAAAHRRDEAVVRFLQAVERYERNFSNDPVAADTARTAYMDLLAARAKAPDVRALDQARRDGEARFQAESIAYLDRHLPLLEVPDHLPDLEILKVKAAMASGNLGMFEAFGRLNEVEARDVWERGKKMAAYASVVRNSLVGRGAGYLTHMTVSAGEHVAAMAWVIAQTLAKLTAHQLTDAQKALAHGNDPHAAVQGAMDLAMVGGTSLGQAWAGLKLAKTVHNQRIQIQMQRRQELRESLDNRKREIEAMVKDHRDGATRKAEYLDQVKLLREQIRGLMGAEPQDRDRLFQQALGSMESLQDKLRAMSVDHQDTVYQIQRSNEISIPALRQAAARALAKGGLYKEASAFEEQESVRVKASSRAGACTIHTAVDAAAHLREVCQHSKAMDRLEDPTSEAVRTLVQKGFGSHGNLAGGMMVLETTQGQMGVLFHPGNPPGVALVPLDLGPGGEFRGFKGRPQVFDLADDAYAKDATYMSTPGAPSALAKALKDDWPKWAGHHGIQDRAQVEAIRNYLGACLEAGGMPLQSSFPESYRHLDALREAGIQIPPTTLGDRNVLPFSSDLEGYWETYANRAADTAKLEAAIKAASLGVWDQAIARQALVSAVRARVRNQQAA